MGSLRHPLQCHEGSHGVRWGLPCGCGLRQCQLCMGLPPLALGQRELPSERGLLPVLGMRSVLVSKLGLHFIFSALLVSHLAGVQASQGLLGSLCRSCVLMAEWVS